MASLTRASVAHILRPNRTRPSAICPWALMGNRSALSTMNSRTTENAAKKIGKFRTAWLSPWSGSKPRQAKSSTTAPATSAAGFLASAFPTPSRTRLRSNSDNGFRTFSARSLMIVSPDPNSSLFASFIASSKAMRVVMAFPLGHASCASEASAPGGTAASYLVAEGGARTAAQLRSSITCGRFPFKSLRRSSLSSSLGEGDGRTVFAASMITLREPQSVSASAQTIN
mmetsp:Transcript_122749/g.261955  ORF Transcript_122749/g.261955 Transcript_122749/m.261955 type:complete len:228 (+) Transcript_122749:427-1110(+)